MNIRIYVAMHRPNNFVLSIKNPIYIPIQCGRTINGNFNNSPDFLPKLGDDTGDNISIKNPYYSELTALYWIWKNDDSQPDDIIGLNHYRRYFAKSFNKKDETKILNGRTIKKLLKQADFIVNGCNVEDVEFDNGITQYYSAYNNYRGCHLVKDLDNSLKCIKELFPDLYDNINFQVKNIEAMCINNMMIAKKKYIDEYCSFIFPVFKEIENYIDFNDEDYQGYQQRVFGFLGERLFRPWLRATRHTAIQSPELNFEKYSGYVWE